MKQNLRRLEVMTSYKYANKICILRSTIKQTKEEQLLNYFI